MAKTLLQEAIAEAKQLREAAIRNATKQLEENLTPSIKEMLAKKLEEELDVTNDQLEEETLDENSNSGFKEVKLKEAEDDSAKDDEPKDDDAPADDEAPADDADAAAEDADAAADDADAAADNADAAAEDANAEAEDAADDDTPLKDITLGDLKSLIQDIVAAGAAPAPEGDLGADMDAGGVEGMGDEVPAGDLAADPDADPAAAGDAAPLDDPNAAADPNADPNATADDDEEIDISEILRELEEEERCNEEKCPECGKEKENCICKENKANDIQPENQNGKEHHKENTSGPSQDDEGLQKENQELKKKNEELEEGVRKLTKTLQDVNLLNAKLVYTTRLLNRQNLSEAQKANVIKTLDNAKSTQEVKTSYKTLLESLKASKKVVTESRRGTASRPAGRSTASTILEGDEMVRRFQQLAGIIND